MKIGGMVIETIELPDKVWVNTYDGKNECGVIVERNHKTESISRGDSLHWSKNEAYWVPLSENTFMESDTHIKLKKIGNSGITRRSVVDLVMNMYS